MRCLSNKSTTEVQLVASHRWFHSNRWSRWYPLWYGLGGDRRFNLKHHFTMTLPTYLFKINNIWVSTCFNSALFQSRYTTFNSISSLNPRLLLQVLPMFVASGAPRGHLVRRPGTGSILEIPFSSWNAWLITYDLWLWHRTAGSSPPKKKWDRIIGLES